ncbi:MAG: 16S rRNA (guanine(527)-N(7))-methyltransferase RsmG [Balneolaceae bacterium]
MKQSVEEVILGDDVYQKAEKLYSAHESELEKYLDLLLSWNEKINLVSRAVSRETVREHIIHSLIPAVKVNEKSLMEGHREWIDTGTGGGMPGIPLAITNKERAFILNDNVRKKMVAVEDMARELNLENASAIAKSISLIDLPKGTGIISKHAFKIDDLLRHRKGKGWETILLYKGVEDAKKELARSRGWNRAVIYSFQFTGNSFYEGKGLVLLRS